VDARKKSADRKKMVKLSKINWAVIVYRIFTHPGRLAGHLDVPPRFYTVLPDLSCTFFENGFRENLLFRGVTIHDPPKRASAPDLILLSCYSVTLRGGRF